MQVQIVPVGDDEQGQQPDGVLLEHLRIGDGQPPAIWRFVQPQLASAALRQGSQPLHGQIAIQPFYGEHPPLLPPRQGPAAWDAPVRLAPTVAREVVNQRASALATLAGKARTALQQRGVAGLGREVLNYVEWQLNGRGQE